MPVCNHPRCNHMVTVQGQCGERQCPRNAMRSHPCAGAADLADAQAQAVVADDPFTTAASSGADVAEPKESIVPDLLSIPDTGSVDLSAHGLDFTVTYYEEQAYGDNGQPVPGKTTGEFYVEQDGVNGPVKRAYIGPDIGNSPRRHAAEDVSKFVMDKFRRAKMDELRSEGSRPEPEILPAEGSAPMVTDEDHATPQEVTMTLDDFIQRAAADSIGPGPDIHDVKEDMADDHVEPCSRCDYDIAENPDDPSERWSTVDYCDDCVSGYQSS